MRNSWFPWVLEAPGPSGDWLRPPPSLSLMPPQVPQSESPCLRQLQGTRLWPKAVKGQDQLGARMEMSQPLWSQIDRCPGGRRPWAVTTALASNPGAQSHLPMSKAEPLHSPVASFSSGSCQVSGIFSGAHPPRASLSLPDSAQAPQPVPSPKPSFRNVLLFGAPCCPWCSPPETKRSSKL